jgi:Dyp-type peroxidase family
MAPAPVRPAKPRKQVAPLDTSDMQGLMARAYGHLPHARYVLLGISEPDGARRWLGQVVEEVSTAAHPRRDEPCVNVAFTWSGLRRLGLADDALATFPRPLQEGMVTEHRSRILGDTGPSAPSGWRWGAPHNPEIHVLLLLFAKTEQDLEAAHDRCRSQFGSDEALVEVGEAIEGRLLDDAGTEHFGFTDGISQPVIRGWPGTQSSVHPPADPPPAKWAEVNPGEVVLGREDNYDKPSEGPTVAASSDHVDLPPAEWGPSGRRHLGHSGTFLVFRQLAQDVVGFRRFVAEAAAVEGGSTGSVDPGLLAAKLVGRWPNGAPVALAPEREDQAPAGANDFGYHELDPEGLRCPLGAHVRRANPRDSSTEHPDKALASTKNHRILRRGRIYGRPVADPPTQPGEDENAARGPLFICLNADFERQFEFVQNTWLVNPFFAGLYEEVDPVVGTQPAGGGRFTVQAEPVRRLVQGLPDFVTVKGGGYFFLPGIRALRHLARLGA